MATQTRPRRTRVYDANYNIGQSLYKPTLDSLDRKYSAGADTSSFMKARSPFFNAEPAPQTPRTRFNLEEAIDDDLKAARARANRAITEESIFDRAGKSFKGSSRLAGIDSDLEDDFHVARLRANRTKVNALMNELDLEDQLPPMKRRPKLDFGEKSLDAVNGEDYSSNSVSFKSRSVKAVARTENVEEPSFTSSFRSKVNSAITDANESFEKSAASSRALQTKARLAEVEQDLFQRSEKQLEREKRASHLKKLLAENDIEPVKALKKVTF